MSSITMKWIVNEIRVWSFHKFVTFGAMKFRALFVKVTNGLQLGYNWITIGLQLDYNWITIGLPRLLATLPVVVRADGDARNSVPSSNAASSFLRDHILPVALLRFDALFLAAQRHHNHATFWRSFGTSFGGAELLRLAVMRRHAEEAAWRRC